MREDDHRRLMEERARHPERVTEAAATRRRRPPPTGRGLPPTGRGLLLTIAADHQDRSTAACGPWTVRITPESAGWTYAGLRVLDLPDGPVGLSTGGEEVIVLPPEGGCEIRADGLRLSLSGRASVFAGPTDFAYLQIETSATIIGRGRVALPSARATRRFPIRYGPAQDVPVEIRGAGQATRQVNDFCSPEAFDAAPGRVSPPTPG